MLSNSELYDLLEAAKAATPGPWTCHLWFVRTAYDHVDWNQDGLPAKTRYNGEPLSIGTVKTNSEKRGWNAKFIAAADPNTVIVLIEEILASRLSLAKRE